MLTHRFVPNVLDPAVEQRGLAEDGRDIPGEADVEVGCLVSPAGLPVEVGAGGAPDCVPVVDGVEVGVGVGVAAVRDQGGGPSIVELVQVVLDLFVSTIAPD